MRFKHLFCLPVLIIELALLTLLITGCGLNPVHTPRSSDQWSNGKLLGTAILNNQVAMQVDEDGNSFLVWVGLEHELIFARLDEYTEVSIQQPLDLHSASAQKPQLLMDSSERLHLTWLKSYSGKKELYYAQLDKQGQVTVSPVRLAGLEEKVGCSRAVFNQAMDRIEVFWSDNRPSNPGLYHLAFDLQGKIVTPSSLIVPEGLNPDARIDRDGFLHLVWSQGTISRDRDIFYAVFDPTSCFLSEKTEVASIIVAPGQVIHGPKMGLDKENGYVFWAVESRARESMVSHAFHITFPLGHLERQVVGEVQAPDDDVPQFDPDEGKFNYYYTAPHVGGAGMSPLSVADTDFLAYPSMPDGQKDELVVTFNGRVYARNTDSLQVIVMEFTEGQIVDYQIVNDSRAASLQPNVIAGSSGELYLTWIDTAGFNRYQVIYASTSRQAKQTLNRITAYDVVDKVLSLVMHAFTAFFFVPIILSWMFLPTTCLIIFFLITRENEISDPHGRGAVGLVMLLQLGVKLFLFPDLLSRLQFDFLPFPSMGFLLGRWIFPGLLAVLSAGLTWAYLKCTRRKSIFVAYFIYTAVDSFLTLLAYVAFPMG